MTRKYIFVLALLAPVLAAGAEPRPIEVHQVLSLPAGEDKIVALTLDACGGGYDAELVRFLVEHHIPATVFATRRWIERHPQGMAVFMAHPELFDIEDHGDRHVPAIIGPEREVYGIRGNPDLAHLKREVLGGARAVEKATGIAPRWYRAATAEYDPEALQAIAALGYRVAGFSVNADDGATLSRTQVAARLQRVKSGDIIIAHVNRPTSQTAAGLSVGLQKILDGGFRFVPLRDAEVRALPDTERELSRAVRAAKPG
ncbi:MAG TPA: polysaccharide deacetylase family protein [Burkholderiales bacterium]|nr:polysaccharide deacetylase family protein [Burkholderiales bacterium]